MLFLLILIGVLMCIIVWLLDTNFMLRYEVKWLRSRIVDLFGDKQ